MVLHRGLRARTNRQLHPYGMDKIEHKHSLHSGMKLAESMLEKEFRRSSQSRRPKKRRLSSSSTTPAPSRAVSISSRTISSTPIFSTPDLEKTIVRTRLSDFGNGCQILLLRAKTADGLMDDIERLWEFHLGDRKLNVCQVSLPWETENSKLLLVRKNDMSDTFTTLLEEIENAPTWQESNGKCSIDVELFVESTK